MTDPELEMDALLGIRTTGRDESHADQDNNPYEPTPYVVLERLANSGVVGKRDTVVDYGCGKGRVGFYISYQARCHSVGIERDRWLYECALRNLDSARSSARVYFEHDDAVDYVPPPNANRFYFFNPFSGAVFARVLERIRESLDASPRPIAVLIYYPDDEYVTLLESTPWLAPDAPIDCRALFGGEDPREQILIYRNPWSQP